MKNFKFVKPFSSFKMDDKHHEMKPKELWNEALHDPAYLLIFGSFLIFVILFLIF
jgi:hypothetical protein